MSAALTRRALVVGAGAALGATALPAVVEAGIPVSAAPAAFDAAGFVAELRAIGCAVYLSRSRSGRQPYGIMSPAGLGFGEDFRFLMQRWDGPLEAHPDHVERVVAHLTAAWEAEA